MLYHDHEGHDVHFLIHIPDCSPADLQLRAKGAGLADLLGGHDALHYQTGPAGTSGLNIGWLSPGNGRLEYSPDEQDWVPSILQVNGKPAYWVGFWKSSAPTEGELRRVPTQEGERVKFGNQLWKLPTPDTVDARAVYAAEGTMFWEPIAQFAWMVDESKALRDTYLEEGGLRMMVFRAEPSAQINWLLKLLRVNYRMTPEVAVRLDLWVGKDHILKTFLKTLGLVPKSEASDG